MSDEHTEVAEVRTPMGDLIEVVSTEMKNPIIGVSAPNDEVTVEAKRDSIVTLLRFLRDDARTQFVNIIDICGVDYPGDAERFEVVYHLLSPKQNIRIRIKLRTDSSRRISWARFCSSGRLSPTKAVLTRLSSPGSSDR